MSGVFIGIPRSRARRSARDDPRVRLGAAAGKGRPPHRGRSPLPSADRCLAVNTGAGASGTRLSGGRDVRRCAHLGELAGQPRPRCRSGLRALQPGQAHVPDRAGIRTQDNVTDEPLDRASQEITHGHTEVAQKVALAQLMVVLDVLPETCELTAQRTDRPVRRGARCS
jgi:hypothetical protein